METTLIQSTILAIIQGLTEFLPISSSAHLILPSQLLGWQDQGLAFDVAVHVGSLMAVLVYFRQEILRLLLAWLQSIAALVAKRAPASGSPDDAGVESEQYAKLAWCLLLASIPAAVAGFLGRSYVEEFARDFRVIAITSICFGLLLWWADARVRQQNSLGSISWQQALWIGIAQALAIIPGTSRSGVTMTAALFLGFTREAAARFSFLLAVPVIAGSGLLQSVDLFSQGATSGQWGLFAYAAIVSALCAFLCIHFFLQLITRIGYLPFVVYRVLLGVLLLVIGFAG